MTQTAIITLDDKLKALNGDLCNSLPARDRAFFFQVSESIRRWGWTKGRERVISDMYARVTAPKPIVETIHLVGAIIDMFKTAGLRLKSPAITIQPDHLSYPVRLSLAGASAREPGTIWITGITRNSFGRRAYYGKITPEGAWVPTPAIIARGEADIIGAFLIAFAANPSIIASRWGHKTGRCCFCNRGLTDVRSTEAGFGETCSKHWGLHNLWMTAHKEAKKLLAA